MSWIHGRMYTVNRKVCIQCTFVILLIWDRCTWRTTGVLENKKEKYILLARISSRYYIKKNYARCTGMG